MQTAYFGLRTCSWLLDSNLSRHGVGLALGRVLLGAAAAVKPLVPRRLMKAIDDRFFGAVFQVTRVTNDNYDSGTQETPANLDGKG